MNEKNKTAILAVIFTGIILVILNLNQYFKFFEFSNPKIIPVLMLVLSLLNVVFWIVFLRKSA